MLIDGQSRDTDLIISRRLEMHLVINCSANDTEGVAVGVLSIPFHYAGWLVLPTYLTRAAAAASGRGTGCPGAIIS